MEADLVLDFSAVPGEYEAASVRLPPPITSPPTHGGLSIGGAAQAAAASPDAPTWPYAALEERRCPGGGKGASVLLALTNAVEGREEEFNEWYSGTHLDEVLEVPGFVAAQRFRRLEPEEAGFGDPGEQRYLALYEIAGDPGPAIAELVRRLGSGEMSLSGASDRASGSLWVYSRGVRR